MCVLKHTNKAKAEKWCVCVFFFLQMKFIEPGKEYNEHDVIHCFALYIAITVRISRYTHPHGIFGCVCTLISLWTWRALCSNAIGWCQQRICRSEMCIRTFKLYKHTLRFPYQKEYSISFDILSGNIRALMLLYDAINGIFRLSWAHEFFKDRS